MDQQLTIGFNNNAKAQEIQIRFFLLFIFGRVPYIHATFLNSFIIVSFVHGKEKTWNIGEIIFMEHLKYGSSLERYKWTRRKTK
jgi:hypothetical protein